MNKYDLALKSNANGMTVHTWHRGYFEHIAALALNPDTDYIEFGKYRLLKAEYEERPEIFNKFFHKNGVTINE